jgi:hypothetical protein
MQQSRVAGIHIVLKKDKDTPMAAKALMIKRVLLMRCSCEV